MSSTLHNVLHSALNVASVRADITLHAVQILLPSCNPQTVLPRLRHNSRLAFLTHCTSVPTYIASPLPHLSLLSIYISSHLFDHDFPCTTFMLGVSAPPNIADSLPHSLLIVILAIYLANLRRPRKIIPHLSFSLHASSPSYISVANPCSVVATYQWIISITYHVGLHLLCLNTTAMQESSRGPCKRSVWRFSISCEIDHYRFHCPPCTDTKLFFVKADPHLFCTPLSSCSKSSVP